MYMFTAFTECVIKGIHLPSNIHVVYIAKRKTVGISDDGPAAVRTANKSEFNFEG